MAATEQSKPAGAGCPSCGTPLTGPFCHNCGAGGGEVSCPVCREKSKAGSRFCSRCGAAIGAAGPAPGAVRAKSTIATVAPWLLGGALGVALIALLLRQPAPGGPGTAVVPGQGSPGAPAAGEGVPPDLSSMTPRERFIRLYDRVIAAAQSGDQATVERFTPMALAAYGMLDTIDADARYHLAMIQLHVGESTGAQAQADSLIRLEPGHLFGYVVDGAVARWNKNTARQEESYRKFRDRYDAEMKSGKPEYAEHKAMLEQLYRTAGGR